MRGHKLRSVQKGFLDPAKIPTRVFFAGSGTPYIHGWQASGSGLGTKYSNPASLVTSSAEGIALRRSNTRLIVLTQNTPFLSAYTLNSTSFGSKVDAVSPPALTNARSLLVDDAGTFCVFLSGSGGSGKRIHACSYDGTSFGTIYEPAVGIGSPGNTRCEPIFSADGSYVIVRELNAPKLSAYEINSSSFGTKYTCTAAVSTAINSEVSTLALLNGGAHILVGCATKLLVVEWNNPGFGSVVYEVTNTSLGVTNIGKFKYSNEGLIALKTGDGTNMKISVYEIDSTGIGSLLAETPMSYSATGTYTHINFMGYDSLIYFGNWNPYLYASSFIGSNITQLNNAGGNSYFCQGIEFLIP